MPFRDELQGADDNNITEINDVRDFFPDSNAEDSDSELLPNEYRDVTILSDVLIKPGRQSEEFQTGDGFLNEHDEEPESERVEPCRETSDDRNETVDVNINEPSSQVHSQQSQPSVEQAGQSTCETSVTSSRPHIRIENHQSPVEQGQSSRDTSINVPLSQVLSRQSFVEQGQSSRDTSINVPLSQFLTSQRPSSTKQGQSAHKTTIKLPPQAKIGATQPTQRYKNTSVPIVQGVRNEIQQSGNTNRTVPAVNQTANAPAKNQRNTRPDRVRHRNVSSKRFTGLKISFVIRYTLYVVT